MAKENKEIKKIEVKDEKYKERIEKLVDSAKALIGKKIINIGIEQRDLKYIFDVDKATLVIEVEGDIKLEFPLDKKVLFNEPPEGQKFKLGEKVYIDGKKEGIVKGAKLKSDTDNEIIYNVEVLANAEVPENILKNKKA